VGEQRPGGPGRHGRRAGDEHPATNVTVSGQLDQTPDGSDTPDGDLEYVPAVEILPMIAPE